MRRSRTPENKLNPLLASSRASDSSAVKRKLWGRMQTNVSPDAVDYTVALALPAVSLRVVTPPSRRFDKGQRVFALAHPDQCVLVRDD